MAYAAHEATALGFLASWRSHLVNLGWIALRFGVDLFGPFAPVTPVAIVVMPRISPLNRFRSVSIGADQGSRTRRVLLDDFL